MELKFITAVWQKGTPIDGYSPDEWRYDGNGNVICWSEYGKTTQYGWEIEHSIPKVRGGSDNIDNLFPMRWRENREKGTMTQPEYEANKFVDNLRAIRTVLGV